jgi:hypothetical protein
MVDILVVGVALQRGASLPALGSDATMGLDEAVPAFAAAATLAHLTSHSMLRPSAASHLRRIL